MPALGSGVLGRHLLALSQRLGPGEFHGLRDYIDGDEPRSIHWKASARSEELKVQAARSQGVRRCIVVLDREASVPGTATLADADVFERAIVAAASLVLQRRPGRPHHALRHRRGIDLRGPEVGAPGARRCSSPLQLGAPLGELERDPGEGSASSIVVDSRPPPAPWRRTERLFDPTLTRVGVFTAPGAARALGWRVDAVDARRRSTPAWTELAGRPSAPRRVERLTRSEAHDSDRGHAAPRRRCAPLERDLAATARWRSTRSRSASGSPGCSAAGLLRPTSLVLVIVGHGSVARPASRRGSPDGSRSRVMTCPAVAGLRSYQYRSTLTVARAPGATWDLFSSTSTSSATSSRPRSRP